MNKEMSEHDFAREMSAENSQWISTHGFSYDGALMLYNYIESWIEDEGFCFDAIALRCEYVEYTMEEYKSEFPDILKGYMDQEEEEDFIQYARSNGENIIASDWTKDIILTQNI